MAFIALALELGIGLTAWVIGKAMEHDDLTKKKEPPKALKVPRVGAGTVMPIVYGHAFVQSPTILWSGNNYVYEDALIAGLFSRSIDVHFGIGVPPDWSVHSDWWIANQPRLMAVWVQGIQHKLGSGGTGILHGIDEQAPVDLGGRGQGGLFDAYFTFFHGSPTQNVALRPDTTPTRLKDAMDLQFGSAISPDAIPGHRHHMTASMITSMLDLGHGSVGESTNMVSIGLEVQALGPSPIEVAHNAYTVLEANPAMVLYDLLCGRVYKGGIPTSLVDKDSFDAAGVVLDSEGHGASYVFDKRGSLADLLVSVLDQINGLIIKDQTTGKLKLKLIRDDYDADAIPLLTKNNMLEPPRIRFTGWGDVVNEVRVEFTDRDSYFRTNHAIAQRGAVASSSSGQINSKTVKYPGITSRGLAAILAARELAICSRPLMTATVKVNRTLYAVEIGDAVRMQVTGIVTDKAFRVLDADHGQLADGAITLTLIEDVFGQALGAYPPWGGHPPFHPPTPILDPG